MVHDMARITWTIKKVDNTQPDVWDITFTGKMVEPVHGPEEQFSIVLNDRSRKELSKANHMIELKIKELLLSDNDVTAITFEGGVWETKNMLLLGPMTFQLLANKLCKDIVINSDVKKKALMLNRVVRFKELFLEFKPKGLATSKENFLETKVNIIIHD